MSIIKLLTKKLDRTIFTTPSHNQKAIFSQEYAARIALACIIDINFMNNSTELTKEFENSITNPALRDKYKNYISRLQNTVFINGAPGVGKTTGVDSLVFKLANKLLGEQGAVISGPKMQQTVNLLNSITGKSYSETEGLNTINDTIKNKKLTAITADMLLNSILYLKLIHSPPYQIEFK